MNSVNAQAVGSHLSAGNATIQSGQHSVDDNAPAEGRKGFSRPSRTSTSRPIHQISTPPLQPFLACVVASVGLQGTTAAQFNAAQFNAAQFNAAQFNAAQFNAAQFNAAQFNAAQFNAAPPSS